jgi:hypothetical protein
LLTLVVAGDNGGGIGDPFVMSGIQTDGVWFIHGFTASFSQRGENLGQVAWQSATGWKFSKIFYKSFNKKGKNGVQY